MAHNPISIIYILLIIFLIYLRIIINNVLLKNIIFIFFQLFFIYSICSAPSSCICYLLIMSVFFNILLILIFSCFSISVFCLVPAFSLFLLYSVHSSILYLYCVPVYCSLSCILWSPLLDSPLCQFLSA